jgi:hypothetical protein
MTLHAKADLNVRLYDGPPLRRTGHGGTKTRSKPFQVSVFSESPWFVLEFYFARSLQTSASSPQNSTHLA